MRKLTCGALLAAAVLVAAPAGTMAQGLGLGVRAGTLGLGGEVALGLTDRFVVRGGIGIMPIEPSATFDDLDVTLGLPTWYSAGLDLYVNGALRLGAGMLFKPDDPEITGEFTSSQEVGSQTYTPQEIGTLLGVIDSNTSAPYVLIGFGKHTDPGVGLFVDLGVAFLSEPAVTLTSEGGTLSGDPSFEASLDEEAASFEADMREYLRYWPILNIGLRIGVN